MQIAVLDEQFYETVEGEIAEKIEDEAEPSETDNSTKIMDKKPDINDVPMEENQVKFLLNSRFLIFFHKPCPGFKLDTSL